MNIDRMFAKFDLWTMRIVVPLALFFYRWHERQLNKKIDAGDRTYNWRYLLAKNQNHQKSMNEIKAWLDTVP